MVANTDYGYDDADAPSTLVPEALLAYRHFALRLEDCQLFPMNVYDSVVRYGGGTFTRISASCYRIENVHTESEDNAEDNFTNNFTKYGDISVVDCSCPLCNGGPPVDPFFRAVKPWRAPTVERPESQLFTATCSRTPASPIARGIAEIAGYTWDSHNSPADGCSCGFYAHYNPETDFYEGGRWDPDDKFAVLRTVVEMSGKVVMGIKGVRAEKMRIIALSVDWAKAQSREAEYDRWRMEYFKQLVNPYYYSVDVYSSDISDSVRAQVEYRAEKAAYLYNTEYHTDPSSMYKFHPQPDISHLLPKEVDLDDVS